MEKSHDSYIFRFALLILVFLWDNLNPGLHCIYSPASTGQWEGETSTTKNRKPCDRGKTRWDISVAMVNYSNFKDECIVVAMNKPRTEGMR